MAAQRPGPRSGGQTRQAAEARGALRWPSLAAPLHRSALQRPSGARRPADPAAETIRKADEWRRARGIKIPDFVPTRRHLGRSRDPHNK